MDELITLTIDGITVKAPAGTLVLEAARRAGIEIPVFCYHPKLKPVGMCRMCLVEIGRPVIDRSTGKTQLKEDGTPQIAYGPNLETSCTVPVSDGMVVQTQTERVKTARREILEFLLTSHPLDCPVCDKGGECPLQTLTMAYGPAESRFYLEDKQRLAKRVPLGELIYLDQERCIQCSRCIRFQDEIVSDPVIAFSSRGRQLKIISYSDPQFDSIFSGNTTDICPVGALTTADFRFGARPWELKEAPSICSHCAVGCNIVYNVRREAGSAGKQVIKRVLPRQNDDVNEIWICDKGRFAYHYTESQERLKQPLARVNGQLVPISWDEAYDLIFEKLVRPELNLTVLAGGRLSNEDLYNLKRLSDEKGGAAYLYSFMDGGDLVKWIGMGEGSNFSNMGSGTTLVVVASDLHEEAPLWWLRIRQAVGQGAKLIVINPRKTRLDEFATVVIQYPYGEESQTIKKLLQSDTKTETADIVFANKTIIESENLVVIYGSEGLGLEGSRNLAQACAALLAKTNHLGKPNNGLIAAWQHANTQGAWELDFKPLHDLASVIGKTDVVWIAGADPLGDDPASGNALKAADFVVVNELFLTETAKRADLVLPVSANTEREGTYTSGERIVQRFYTALPAGKEIKPDYEIFNQVGNRLNYAMGGSQAGQVFFTLCNQIPAYSGLSYQKLSRVERQSPISDRQSMYYGGVSYDNRWGLGVQLPVTSDLKLQELELGPEKPESIKVGRGEVLLVPVTKLYDQGTTLKPSDLLKKRMAGQTILMHPALAKKHGLLNGDTFNLIAGDMVVKAGIKLDDSLPQNAALCVRSTGLPVNKPMAVVIKKT